MSAEPAVPAEPLAAIRAPFLDLAAEVVDAPILQPLGLLLELVGEAMRPRLFVVQSEGGQETCLRPDFTVPVVRQHLESGRTSGRYFYEGKAFRASPEPGRPDEFRQIGLERFDAAGSSVVQADADIAVLAWRSALAGGRSDLSLWLGDIALFAAFVDSLGLAAPLAARVKRVASRPRLLAAELARAEGAAAAPSDDGKLAGLLSGLSEAEAATVLEEVWALAGIDPVGGRGPAEIAQRLIRRAQAAQAPALTGDQADRIRRFLAIEDAPQAAFDAMRAVAGAGALDAPLAAWAERLELLTAAGVPAAKMHFATALGHAFDYYDGLTFEIRSAALDPERSVAVGGRYDSLPSRLGGASGARAVGCVVRPWRAWAGGES
ncbi:ATP phosphoribosyltransferase regulatory subunit [Phenylobacterium sp. NIBR 498073]|uniref:ATP phosphoribosyltransferase regulatory subunit n=1 Tax=Phenylobacterium sp. NIBR 498073 TaxID=3015177 RepID=UPI0022B5D72C|nr:ATP phosphoribosyltransferase regulatory subunit [Phenylobacterium sp. NIBR 498073]WGU39945.1 ATP phosphoribosyltransferase regulatory subunit [Phenylobacterium sp. NIBR 498073]